MKITLLSIAALILTACATPVPKMEKTHDQMTEREKQEAIANSKLPGAKLVRKGLAIADAENHREALLDSIASEN